MVIGCVGKQVLVKHSSYYVQGHMCIIQVTAEVKNTMNNREKPEPVPNKRVDNGIEYQTIID